MAGAQRPSPFYEVKDADIAQSALFRAYLKDGACPPAFSQEILVKKFDESDLGEVVLDKTALSCGESVRAELKNGKIGTIQNWEIHYLGYDRDTALVLAEVPDDNGSAEYLADLFFPLSQHAPYKDYQNANDRLRSPGYYRFAPVVQHDCGFTVMAGDSFKLDGPEIKADFDVSRNTLCLDAGPQDISIAVKPGSMPAGYELQGWHSNLGVFTQRPGYPVLKEQYRVERATVPDSAFRLVENLSPFQFSYYLQHFHLTPDAKFETTLTGGETEFETADGLTREMFDDRTNWQSPNRWESFINDGGELKAVFYPQFVSADGKCRVVSETAVELPVVQAANSLTLGADRVVCTGNTTKGPLAVETKREDLLYSWESSSDAENWSCVTGTDCTLQPPALNADVRYRALVSDPVCQVENYTNEIKLEVVPETKGGVMTAAYETWRLDQPNPRMQLTGHAGNLLYWQFSDDGGATWTDFAHIATNYTEEDQLFAPRQYRAAVQATGCPKLYSTPVNLVPITDPMPEGGIALANPVSVCPDAAFNLELTDHIGDVVRWDYRGDILEWVRTDDQGNILETFANTTSQLELTNVQENQFFRAKVRISDCKSVYTEIFESQVRDEFNYSFVFTGDDPEVVCAGAEIELEHAGSGFSPVEWQASTDGGANWNGIWDQNSGVSFDNFRTPPINVETQFRLVVEPGNANCPAEPTDPKNVTVIPEIQPGTLAQDKEACIGESVNITHAVGASGANIVEWYVSDDGGATWTPQGFNGNTLLIEDVTIPLQVRVEEKLPACDEEFTAVLDVAPNPVTFDLSTTFGTLNAPAEACGANAPIQISTDIRRDEVSDWERSTDGGATWTSEQQSREDRLRTMINEETSFRAKTIRPGCVAKYSEVAVVQYSKGAGKVSGTAEICVDAVAGFELKEYEGAVVDWQYAENCRRSNAVSVGSTSDQVSIPNLESGRYCVWAEVSNALCGTLQTDWFELRVNRPARPGALEIENSVVCSESNPRLTWRPEVDAQNNRVGDGWITAWELSNGDGNWTQQQAVGAGYAPKNLTEPTFIRAVISSPGCGAVRSNEVYAEVLPAVKTGTLSADATTFCYNDPAAVVNLSLRGHNHGIIRWEQSVDGGASWAEISFSGADFTVERLNQTSLFRAVVACDAGSPYYSNEVEIVTDANCGTDPCAGFSVDVDFSNQPASCATCADGMIIYKMNTQGAFLGGLNCGAPTISPIFTNLTPGVYEICFTETNSGCEAKVQTEVPVKSACPAPQLVEATGGKTTAYVEWTSVNPADEYMLYWRKKNNLSASWTAIRVQGFFFNIYNLEAGAEYEFMIRSRCGTNMSDERLRGSFELDKPGGLCGAPVIANIMPKDREAKLIWNPAPNAVGYQIAWRAKGRDMWTNLRIDRPVPTEYVLHNLNPSTIYEVRIRTICPVGVSAWSEDQFISDAPRLSVAESSDAAVSAAVYPNPSRGAFTLALEGAEAGPADLVVFDLAGKAVWRQTATLTDTDARLSLETDLPSGVYFLEARQSEQRIRIKVQIAR